MNKKLPAALLAVIVACLHGKAQLKPFSIGLYAELGMPAGTFKQENKNGLGAGLNMDIRLSRFALTGSAGFMRFGGKTVTEGGESKDIPTLTAVPVRVGLKYYFLPLLYMKVEGGVANYLENDNSAFILSPGVGVRLLGLDVQLKYETWILDGSRSFVGLKAGYNF